MDPHVQVEMLMKLEGVGKMSNKISMNRLYNEDMEDLLNVSKDLHFL